MIRLPETTMGDFYNGQHRQTSTVQWIESLSTSRKWPGGQHLPKIGSDLIADSYDGRSASAPVIIERSNGTVAQRLDDSGPSLQQVHSVDAAVFAQDRIQPLRRWYVEIGARVDRDGVADDVSASPRRMCPNRLFVRGQLMPSAPPTRWPYSCRPTFSQTSDRRHSDPSTTRSTASSEFTSGSSGKQSSGITIFVSDD